MLLLAPGDSIAVATAALPEGTERAVAGARIVLRSAVAVGHKFAVRRIAKGERIVKYGAPIALLRLLSERVLAHDMDLDAGRILEGRASLDQVGKEIYDRIRHIAQGERTKSEALGHQEFVLMYKTFEPLGPACFPSAA